MAQLEFRQTVLAFVVEKTCPRQVSALKLIVISETDLESTSCLNYLFTSIITITMVPFLNILTDYDSPNIIKLMC